MINEPIKQSYKTVTLTQHIFKKVEDYRFDNRIQSMTKAVEAILLKGLEASKNETAS